jgi:hypothetical protein
VETVRIAIDDGKVAEGDLPRTGDIAGSGAIEKGPGLLSRPGAAARWTPRIGC